MTRDQVVSFRPTPAARATLDAIRAGLARPGIPVTDSDALEHALAVYPLYREGQDLHRMYNAVLQELIDRNPDRLSWTDIHEIRNEVTRAIAGKE